MLETKPMKDIKPDTLEQQCQAKKRRAKAIGGGPNKIAPGGPDKLLGSGRFSPGNEDKLCRGSQEGTK